MSSRRKDPFNNPFGEVQGELENQLETRRRQQSDAERDRQLEPLVKPPVKPPVQPLAESPEPTTADDEERSFAQAMAGVTPLASDDRVVPSRLVASSRAVEDADVEAYAVLADLVAGHGDFDIADTVEYVEGVAPGVDRRLLKRLRQGDFALQGHLDLHGLTRDEARTAVERFLAESRVGRKRCVLLIHGRGLNSPDRVPVLKNALVMWLTRSGLAKRVLAFATARPVDGGAGALYVLLRK